MANEIGKQYICKKCGIVFVVTKGGKGQIKCCGEPMETK
jgi:desulfoferrodoxin-like iron-binding protein